jgi:PTS system mannose-specific IIA component
MITGIVVTHGNLAEELLETARIVFGDFGNCYAVSNVSKSPGALIAELKKIIDSHEDAPAIIFVDYFGGSCTHACLSLQQHTNNIRIISGVNLPMLVVFLNKRNDAGQDDLADELILKGQGSIKRVELEEL